MTVNNPYAHPGDVVGDLYYITGLPALYPTPTIPKGAANTVWNTYLGVWTASPNLLPTDLIAAQIGILADPRFTEEQKAASSTLLQGHYGTLGGQTLTGLDAQQATAAADLGVFDPPTRAARSISPKLILGALAALAFLRGRR